MSSRNVLAFAAVLVLLGFAAFAHADEAAAEAAFREARRLTREGRHAEACPQFEASYRESPALGALLNLAVCHQQIGRTASAYAELRRAEEMARQRADSREAVARELADALAPQLTRLRVELVTPNAPGVVVYRNGVDIMPDLGISVPVDPGEHALEASAPGHVVWTATVIAAGEGEIVVVHVPALQRAPVSASAAPPLSPAPRAALVPLVSIGDTAPRPRVRRAAALGLGGAAVLTLGSALACGIWGELRYREAEDATVQGEADELVAAANRRYHAAQGLAIAGAGLAAASAYLWFTREEGGASAGRRLAVAPVIGAGGAHAVLQGTF